ncbi:MAG: hypothetical protein KDK75_22325, partial [Alphaproteobacteria bacterium]|nr:hypothetical protein [Alphaproteobacteria bacterium]
PASSTHPAAVVARTEPPDAVRSSPYLLLLWTSGAVNRAELERRAESVRQLRERFSATPIHARRARHDPDYWNKLYESRVTL